MNKEKKQQKVSTLILTDDEVVREKHPPAGKPWLFDKQWIYLAKREGEQLVEFDPLEEKKDEKENEIRSPEELFDALDWILAKMVFQVTPKTWEKLNTGLLIALVGVLLFFIFLMYSSVTGG